MNAPRARQTPRPLILFALLAASSCGSENEPVRGASGSTGLGGTGGDSGGAGGNAGVSSGGSSASAGTGSGGAAGSAGAATGGTGALGGSSGSGATGGTSGSGSSPGTGGASPGNVYFRADHENPNPNGDQRYNYSYKYPQGSWTWTHLPTGGWGASGAAHIQMHAGQTQYSFGFVTQQLGHTFQNGEGVYIRFRIRYDEAMRGTPDWGNKFILMGTTGTTPNSRLIIYMNPPHPSRGCTLDFTDNGQTPAWAVPSYYGVSGSSFASLIPVAWSLAPHVNISWDCGPPVLQTIPSNPLEARPGPANSAKAVDGWYHIQIYAQSGGPGQGVFKSWANNNDFNSPSAERNGLTGGLGVVGWGDGAVIGGYMDNATPTTDLGYVIDDVEIGDTFHPAWYP